MLYNLLEATLNARAVIRLHTGKTLTWNLSGKLPVDMDDLGPDAWNPQGAKILGSPVGHAEFFVEDPLRDEPKWWDAIPWVPDLQLGRCSFHVPGRVVITCCEQSHRRSQRGTRRGTTWRCNAPWRGSFWAWWAHALPVLQQRLLELTRHVTHHFSVNGERPGAWESCKRRP